MMCIRSLAILAVIGLVSAASHETHAQLHRRISSLHERQLGAMSYQGCYSTAGSLNKNTTYTWNTEGWCQTQCVPAGYNVVGVTAGKDCYCGNSVPPSSDKVDDSKCNTPCAGYGENNCGGSGTFMVYLDGRDDSSTAGSSTSQTASASSSSSASSTVSASPSVVTVGGQTMTVTAGATETEKSKSGGTSKAGVAAGVVVGLLAAAGAAAGGYLVWRKKQRRELLEAAPAVSEYSAKPAMSPGSSFDSHLDSTVVANNRMSTGSLQDGADYSRRILKVTNA